MRVVGYIGVAILGSLLSIPAALLFLSLELDRSEEARVKGGNYETDEPKFVRIREEPRASRATGRGEERFRGRGVAGNRIGTSRSSPPKPVVRIRARSHDRRDPDRIHDDEVERERNMLSRATGNAGKIVREFVKQKLNLSMAVPEAENKIDIEDVRKAISGETSHDL